MPVLFGQYFSCIFYFLLSRPCFVYILSHLTNNIRWVYNNGNLITDLLDNLLLESTGVLPKTRIYEMSSNQTFRETLAFLIVRDNAHQNAFAKSLETLGVELAKLSPVPNYDINSAKSMLN